MSAGAAADAAAVLIEGDVTDPMQAVFDRPVAAVQFEQALRTGVLGFEAGDAVDGFAGECSADALGALALDRKDLGGMGELQIALEPGAGPDPAHFQAAMRFLSRLVLRGGKTANSAWRSRRAGWAGCP